jgi:hypothetical protein
LGWRGVALGQAQPISADASGLTDYQSQNQGTDGPKEETPPDPELLRVRGEEKKDEEVHMLISWTTRKDYPTVVGISLPIPVRVGEEFHEGQLWEEMADDMMIEAKHAERIYDWLIERLRGRSSEGMLPTDMPASISEVTVQTWKDGGAGHILFTPEGAIMTPMNTMEVQAVIEYDMGYMRVGMGNAYTIGMLVWEFLAITQRQWRFLPLNGYRRLIDGAAVHRVTTDHDLFSAAIADQEIQVLPAKVLEERGRGTLISKLADQGKLLQCWAWMELPAKVLEHYVTTSSRR